MANPILNEKAAEQAARAGWAAPDAAVRSTNIPAITDGPVSSWQSAGDVMTVRGTVTATGVLMVLLLAAATAGWVMGPTRDSEVTGFPALALGGMIVGFICAIVVSFKPQLAKVLGPIYAVAEGFFLGVISKSYNNWQDGIVVQAVGATLGVFLVMLFLYKSRIIKVTDRFKRIVIMATMGLMALYLVSFLINIFGGNVAFLQSASPMGILFSVFAAGLAAMMLAVDFDLIEKGAKAGWPKGMEWYAAFGLLTTLVWLYLELLRLIAKLNQR
ncbi:MAG: Bax inhibitor-1/YccA family protein [Actinobacteria bacterium]|nr:Bax inhibitor-1/YccA family protein [Acidimicrobiaceae bacterium]MBP8208898.1 Bax inhibitor-1/YccA family protein [Ilumatobacteraceae bacterium]NMD24081.1 Bax inhibitor-1/YccA family protein [Actinomycetota bacterium]MBP9054040.1 Bax inhibitor-1/YccA family protein [Ilumatobacteraceae bacterium]HQY14591.1 Bax inhibitor-1/YccA family protein [Ilumatobacteraceae bacterium]